MKFDNMNYTLCDPCAGVGTMLLYAVEKCGYKKENCYGIELDELNVAILQKLGFVNIIQGDASDPKTWEKFGKDMKFDRIIMNPPYNGNLHLKILSEAIKHSDEVVNLSPIRWLQDPLAEYKKNSDWKTFENIRKRIDSIDEIKAEDAQKIFGSGQYENLGIYKFTKNGGANIIPKPFISQALFDKVNLPTYQGKYKSLYDVRSGEGKPDFTKPFVRCSVLHGNVGTKTWADIITPQKEIAFSKESRSKGSANFTFNFDTEKERDNFYAYTQTKFVRACNANVKTNIRWPGYAIPFMPTYTHPWTDEMLYDYFDLTQEERAVIESSIES